MMLTRSLAATAVLSLVLAGAGRALAGGGIFGNTGGNEKAVWLYERGVGEIRWAFTGVDGLYRFEDLDPATYLIHGPGGGVIALIDVEEGETSTLDFAEQPGYDTSTDVWSPARREFGQTFRATGRSLVRVEWWIPGPPVRLSASVHEGGPGGRQIGPTVETEEPVSWFAGLGWAGGAVPLTPGETYYLRIGSTDGAKWNIGMPGPGDVVPDGMAYFDGQPQADSDLAVNIGESGLHPWVSTGHGGHNLGFIAEGPGSGNCLSAGQTFVATTRNVLMAGTDAGWGGDPLSTQFNYAIYEDRPGGKQIGPTCRAGMVSDWGTTAAWFPDDIPLELGKRYYLKYWRADGKPFYSYLSKDVYPQGTAFRDDKPMPDFDLSFSVEGEMTPFSICWPYNIRVTETSGTEATIEWDTGTPSISQVEYGENAYDHVTPASADLAKHHRVTITGLRPGVGCVYRVICDTRLPGSRPLRSRGYQFMTPSEARDRPTMLEPPGPPPPTAPPAHAVRLENPSFEEGAKGWRQVGKAGAATGAVDGYVPHSGDGMWGWRYQYEGRRGQPIVDQTSTYDLLHQTIEVEPGRSHEFSAWILTGDRGSGWGRDSRVRLIVDRSARAEFPDLEHVDDSVATQWFATRDQWVHARLRFKATGDRAVVGFHFWQWWFLRADYLFVDDAQVVPVAE